MREFEGDTCPRHLKMGKILEGRNEVKDRIPSVWLEFGMCMVGCIRKKKDGKRGEDQRVSALNAFPGLGGGSQF